MFWNYFIWVVAIGAGLGVIYFVASERRMFDKRSWERPNIFNYLWALPAALAGLLVACIVALVCAFVLSIFISEDYTYKQNLPALQDGNSIHGAFFLGIGGVDSLDEFTFYSEDHGKFSLETVDARHAQVAYTTEAPYLLKTENCSYKSFWMPFDNCWTTDYVFYVPKGSISTNYTLDAK